MTSKEQKQAEKLLQHSGIGLHDIGSFSFMKRYYHLHESYLRSLNN